MQRREERAVASAAVTDASCGPANVHMDHPASADPLITTLHPPPASSTNFQRCLTSSPPPQSKQSTPKRAISTSDLPSAYIEFMLPLTIPCSSFPSFEIAPVLQFELQDQPCSHSPAVPCLPLRPAARVRLRSDEPGPSTARVRFVYKLYKPSRERLSPS